MESVRSRFSVIPPVHDRDLFLGQSVQFVHQRVDLGVDLGLDPRIEALSLRHGQVRHYPAAAVSVHQVSAPRWVGQD